MHGSFGPFGVDLEVGEGNSLVVDTWVGYGPAPTHTRALLPVAPLYPPARGHPPPLPFSCYAYPPRGGGVARPVPLLVVAQR